jgi:hypothetical protein
MTFSLSPSKFLLWFAGSIVCCLLIIGVYNALVDPYGEVGSRLVWPQGELRGQGAIEGRGRSAKIILLNDLPAPPQVLILGNSRSVALPTDTITQEIGLRAFNAATVNASMYDLLAFTRFVLDQPEQDLKAVIVGLDMLMFQVPVDEELKREPLVGYLPELNQNALQTTGNLLLRLTSFDTVMASLNLLYRHYVQSDPFIYTYSVRSRFQPNGTLTHLDLDPQAEADTFPGPLEDHIEAVKLSYEAQYSVDDPLPTESRELWETWLKLTQEHKLCVIVFLPPYLTELTAYLETHSGYPQFREAYLDYLSQLGEEYDFTFYDFESPEDFDGEDRWFIEGVHPLSPNTRRLMEHITADGLCELSPDVIQ